MNLTCAHACYACQNAEQSEFDDGFAAMLVLMNGTNGMHGAGQGHALTADVSKLWK